MPNWGERAERLLEEALAELREPVDAIPKVTEALCALYLDMNERPQTIVLDVAGYEEHVHEEETLVANADELCTCPPGLVKSGGWRSSCVVHGTFAQRKLRAAAS